MNRILRTPGDDEPRNCRSVIRYAVSSVFCQLSSSSREFFARYYAIAFSLDYISARQPKPNRASFETAALLFFPEKENVFEEIKLKRVIEWHPSGPRH